MTSASAPALQLYTVRDAIRRDLHGTLGLLARIGFRQVEPWGFVDRAAEYAEGLAAAGLAAPSAHARLIGADLDATFSAAYRLGIPTVIEPHIPEGRWSDRESVEAIAAELGAVAERAAGHGLRIGYHNHAFELERRIDGVSALEVLAGALPDEVVLEVDTYWAEVGGEPAPALLRRLGERVAFLHVKDGPRTKDDRDQVAVGRGRLPIAEILAAAPLALPVIELDDFDGDVLEAVADSLRFLEGVRA